MNNLQNKFGALAALPGTDFFYYRLAKLQEDGIADVTRLPYSIRILLEGLLRNYDGKVIAEEDVARLAQWEAQSSSRSELPFKPSRVILQDFTGVPVVVDLASMRSAMARFGGDPGRINPVVPVDLVIDHSVQVDTFGSSAALLINAEREFERNKERYEFLKWGEEAFDNFRVVPPATGIVHQVNLEFLGKVVMTGSGEGDRVAYPDTVVGTDSHTTMINGLGVVGWGVGGIEAEAAMLGQPIHMLTPDVVGLKLVGGMPEGSTATDLVLAVTQLLRQKGVVGAFVEYFGPGLSTMSLPDRATLANMCPEYGATVGFFPVDGETLDYLRRTGRPVELVNLVEQYCKAQRLFRFDDSPDPEFTSVLELDLNQVEPSLAGPNRPQDRIRVSQMKSEFEDTLRRPVEKRGFNLAEDDLTKKVSVSINGSGSEMEHGSVAIAAITSCTNTSNPSVMITAGLLAKKAVEYGLSVEPFVKTSLAPGSRVVSSYLDEAGLTPYLDKLGFDVVGYGCTTCIGNSGPLSEQVSEAIEKGNLIVAAVLSGNRNFEGRIHAQVRAAYLASPPLVVAYALAGRVGIDFTIEPLGTDESGNAVYLSDLWPSRMEVSQLLSKSLTPEMFRQQYGNVYTGNNTWNEIPGTESELYAWDTESTYIQEPPFFEGLSPDLKPITDIYGARVLVKVGDSVTTDHISPAGAIASTTPAGRYLIENGVAVRDFNSYGSRRGNDRIVTRGAFANVRLRNQMAPGTEGGWTTYLPTGEVMAIYDASLKYQESGTPLVVLAGSAYGTGSSRDQAAKGTLWLGVKFVIAQSYERIHRSNLVGMGVLPLQFSEGQNAESLDLDGSEMFSTVGLSNDIQPGQGVTIHAEKADGRVITFQTVCRIDTPVEIGYYRNGGILRSVLRDFLNS